jgi:hypothetical protein
VQFGLIDLRYGLSTLGAQVLVWQPRRVVVLGFHGLFPCKLSLAAVVLRNARLFVLIQSGAKNAGSEQKNGPEKDRGAVCLDEGE